MSAAASLDPADACYKVWLVEEQAAIGGEAVYFRATLRTAPRYVDSDRYNGCGECAEVCPKRFASVFDAGLAEQLAAYRLYPQATPDSFVIEKRSVAPCCAACPAGQRAQGYISLIREGRVDDVYRSIIEDNPFPRHQLDWFPEQKDQAVGVAFDCPAADFITQFVTGLEEHV